MTVAIRSFLRARPTLLFILVALVIPNILFLGATLFGIGAPVRVTSIILYVMAAVLARHIPAALAAVIYLALVAFDITNTVALLFNLSPRDIMTALDFGLKVDFFDSPFYVLLAAGVAATTALNIWLYLTQRPALRQARLLPPLLLLVAFCLLDMALNATPHHQFRRILGAVAPFESAVRASGFEAAALEDPPRHRLIVMVESLGLYESEAQRQVLMAPFRDPALAARYDISSGNVTYFGSTKEGELRELCASRAYFETYFEREDATCLPARLAARGYDTQAMHGFHARMFQRARWWPNVGFDRTLFLDDMPALRQCGGVWMGACDQAVAALLHRNIRDAARPTLFYWLTLNTHIPVVPDLHSKPFPCDESGPYGDSNVCHMTAMWYDIFASVVAIAKDPALAPLDILIVGDHAPPLWARRHREMFVAGQVPWIRLRPKPTGAGGT